MNRKERPMQNAHKECQKSALTILEGVQETLHKLRRRFDFIPLCGKMTKNSAQGQVQTERKRVPAIPFPRKIGYFRKFGELGTKNVERRTWNEELGT